MKWYDAYDSFLKHNGFAKAFPTVDDLTRAMGNVTFYYQGRVIENIRISNTVDAYAVNGWESMKLEITPALLIIIVILKEMWK